ncbi:MAG TPA: type II toxin-antitoxin system death-on-curing family toxin [Chthonomonadaceae bacterium]|nr:type II toxin-antitoxin system death-on-curing family toxin [Chthonomonadaceae bacterium]
MIGSAPVLESTTLSGEDRVIAYLTVHDLVWINTTVTGRVNPYDWVTLEAAMAAQYRYGESQDVPGQAASLLQSLLFKPPFASGNRRTAFIAALTFLNANGYATKVQDREAADIVLSVIRRERTPEQAIAELAAPSQQALPAGLTLRKLITHECNLHVEALKILAEGD